MREPLPTPHPIAPLLLIGQWVIQKMTVTNEMSARVRPRWVHQIAQEVCELVQQQVDALRRQGLAEGDLPEYMARREQIDKLQVELRNLRRRQA